MESDGTFVPQELNRVLQKAKELKKVGVESLIWCGFSEGDGVHWGCV